MAAVVLFPSLMSKRVLPHWYISIDAYLHLSRAHPCLSVTPIFHQSSCCASGSTWGGQIIVFNMCRDGSRSGLVAFIPGYSAPPGRPLSAARLRPGHGQFNTRQITIEATVLLTYRGQTSRDRTLVSSALPLASLLVALQQRTSTTFPSYDDCSLPVAK